MVPPPEHCPGCDFRLHIPTSVEFKPEMWIEATCKGCKEKTLWGREWAGRERDCPICGLRIKIPNDLPPSTPG